MSDDVLRPDLNKLFSHLVMVPVQADDSPRPGAYTIIDWRGIPLATPFQYDSILPDQRVPLAKKWHERGCFFLKLVHPSKGTTVDYVIRCLFNPRGESTRPPRIFVFLEMAPGAAGGGETVPVWTVVEVLGPDAVRTLTEEETRSQWEEIQTIVGKQLGVPDEAVMATFGQMPPWENPDWGDEGNIHLACIRCCQPVPRAGIPCSRCPAPAPSGDGGLQPGGVKLVITQGRDLNKAYLLDQDTMVIGRLDADSKNYPDLDLEDQDTEFVHRKHATLTFEGGVLMVCHHGTVNPTLINNQPVPKDEKRPLRVGDRLKVGKVVLQLKPS